MSEPSRRFAMLLDGDAKSLPTTTCVHNTMLPARQWTQATAKDRETMVKVNDSNSGNPASRATREQIMERINRARNSKNRNLGDPRVQIRAIERHPSGHLMLYTECKEHMGVLIREQAEWEGSVGPKAQEMVPTFRVLIHGMSTELATSNTTDIKNRIKRDNPVRIESSIHATLAVSYL